jgi:hypothetical protein
LAVEVVNFNPDLPRIWVAFAGDNAEIATVVHTAHKSRNPKFRFKARHRF